MSGSSPSPEARQRRIAPLRHGVYATNSNALQLRNRRVRRLVNRMRDAMPWLDPADESACRAWAELEILASGAFMELQGNGMLTDDGQPRRLIGEYRLLRQAQLAYERDLGMTPAARMNLQVGGSRSHALDIAAELANERFSQSEDDS